MKYLNCRVCGVPLAYKKYVTLEKPSEEGIEIYGFDELQYLSISYYYCSEQCMISDNL